MSHTHTRTRTHARTRTPQHLVTHQVLAIGRRLGTYVIREMENLVRPVAPTKLAKPPIGTRELGRRWKEG